MFRRSPGRSASAAYYDNLSDSEGEMNSLAKFEFDFEHHANMMDTAELGASVARHDYVTLSDTDPIAEDEDGKSAQVLGSLIRLSLPS